MTHPAQAPQPWDSATTPVDGPGPDRFLSEEIEAVVEAVRSGAVLAAARSAVTLY